MVLSARDAISMMLGLKAMTEDCKIVVGDITLEDFESLTQGKGRILSVAERLDSVKTTCQMALERAKKNKRFKSNRIQQDLFEAFTEFCSGHGKLLDSLAEKANIGASYLPITKIAHAVENVHDAISDCTIRLAKLCPAWSAELLEGALPELDTKANEASGSWLGTRDDEMEGIFDFQLTHATGSGICTP